MAYFDEQKNDEGNTTTINLSKKCVICESLLNRESEMDICEKCKVECDHTRKILEYLKTAEIKIQSAYIGSAPRTEQSQVVEYDKISTSTQETSWRGNPNTIDEKEPVEKTPNPEYIPPLAVDYRVVNPQRVHCISSPKVYTGTTVLGQESAFYTGALDESSSAIEQRTAWLIRLSTKEKTYIEKMVFTIGKKRHDVDYWVSGNKAVSRKHAQIIFRNNNYFILDCNSTNGTFINGKQIKPFIETKIDFNDEVCFGDERHIFYIE